MAQVRVIAQQEWGSAFNPQYYETIKTKWRQKTPQKLTPSPTTIFIDHIKTGSGLNLAYGLQFVDPTINYFCLIKSSVMMEMFHNINYLMCG
jgi:hypothetical protein